MSDQCDPFEGRLRKTNESRQDEQGNELSAFPIKIQTKKQVGDHLLFQEYFIDL